MRLALFDLDHTLLPIDSADTWSYFVVNKGGLDPAAYGARIEEFAQTYRAGTFDIEGYVRFQMELLALFPRAMLDPGIGNLWNSMCVRIFEAKHWRWSTRTANAATSWRW